MTILGLLVSVHTQIFSCLGSVKKHLPFGGASFLLRIACLVSYKIKRHFMKLVFYLIKKVSVLFIVVCRSAVSELHEIT